MIAKALLALGTVALAQCLNPSAWADPVDAQRLVDVDSEPGAWIAHGRNYAEDRESPLTSIHPGNVAELGLAWYFDTETTRGLEATPLVFDGVMVFTTSWSQVFALDPVTGEQLWHYDPEVPRSWGVNACCDVVNRGVAAWGDNVYVGTLDGRLVALDRNSGAVRWSVLTIDRARPYTITGAPRVANGKVFIGNGGAEYGVRGYASAYDAATGALVWRFHTVPGNPAKPFESGTMAMAAKTWTGDVYWKVGGGGTVWDSMAYDPDLNYLYIGVGNGSPWNRWVRSPGGGDNLFLSSIVALNADTGEYVWHYQTTPGDTWDYTATQHMILAELEIDGVQRDVIMQAPKNGFFYVIDRRTGELISADNYVPVSWATHVDPASGRPVESATADHSVDGQTVAPAALGGHNWQPMAFNREAGLVYIPALDLFQSYSTADTFEYQAPPNWNLGQADPMSDKGATFTGMPRGLMEALIRKLTRGRLIAWDPVAREERWRVEHSQLWNGGLLTTASGLVFQGTGDRRLFAYDAATGQTLWEAPTGTGVVAPPITYQIDGVQYVAVLAGWGGVAGLVLPQSEVSNGTSRMLVYRLGGTADHPIDPVPLRLAKAPLPVSGDDESVARGERLYGAHCSRCHGLMFGHGGVVKDLRYVTEATHGIFDDIVLRGVYSGVGMVSFGDVLNEDDSRDIQSYVLQAANETWDAQQSEGSAWTGFVEGVYEVLSGIVAWGARPVSE